MVRFEKVDLQNFFYFLGFELVRIEKSNFLKIYILDKACNTVLTIYEKEDDSFNWFTRISKY